MALLITGGTGFIGANLARKLVEQEMQVVLMEISPNMKLIEDIASNVEIVRGDVTNWAEVVDTVNSYNITKIFHTAALLSDNAEKYPLRAYCVNATGTWNILESARQFKVEQVIFTSTLATYGDHVSEPVSNDAPQFPRILYGATKVAGERLGEYYFYRFGVDFRGIRFPSVIGPGRGSGGVSAFTTLIVQYAAMGLPYDIYVSPEIGLPIIYIEDCIRALLMLSNAPNQALSRRVYNVRGIPCTSGELVNLVKSVIPSAELRFVPDEHLTSLVRQIPAVIDDSLARNDWDWNETLDLKTSVKLFVKEVQKQPQRYSL